jgi:hypothetical protein
MKRKIKAFVLNLHVGGAISVFFICWGLLSCDDWFGIEGVDGLNPNNIQANFGENSGDLDGSVDFTFLQQSAGIASVVEHDNTIMLLLDTLNKIEDSEFSESKDALESEVSAGNWKNSNNNIKSGTSAALLNWLLPDLQNRRLSPRRPKSTAAKIHASSPSLKSKKIKAGGMQLPQAFAHDCFMPAGQWHGTCEGFEVRNTSDLRQYQKYSFGSRLVPAFKISPAVSDKGLMYHFCQDQSNLIELVIP